MDGWKITFLLGNPIFRGELLVLGSVSPNSSTKVGGDCVHTNVVVANFTWWIHLENFCHQKVDSLTPQKRSFVCSNQKKTWRILVGVFCTYPKKWNEFSTKTSMFFECVKWKGTCSNNFLRGRSRCQATKSWRPKHKIPAVYRQKVHIFDLKTMKAAYISGREGRKKVGWKMVMAVDGRNPANHLGCNKPCK